MKRIITFIICMAAYLIGHTQQNLGIRNSNYAGIQGSLLNPSSIAGNKLDWDVNVFSAGEVFQNNFLFAPKNSLHFFGIKRIIKGAFDEDLFLTKYDAQNPNKKYNVTLSSEILGPSFFMKLAKKHEIGLTIEGRAYGDVKDIPGHLGQNAFVYFRDPSLWNTTFQDNSTRVNSMAWMQYGFHYATVIYHRGNDELKAGITLNYLKGMFGAYLKNNNVGYRVGDTTNFSFANTSIDYGRTDFDTYKDIKNLHDLNHGHGFGVDIGFTYVHRKEGQLTENEKSSYIYKLGLSLIDIGAIRFNKNAAAYHLEAANANFEDWHASKFASNVQVDRTLSAVFYNGDSSRSLSSEHFKMGMPAAISVQYDRHIYKHYYANVTIIKGFGHGDKPGVIRPDIYSITPRYETKWFEASIPISLLQYYGQWQPRLGIAVRAGYFFIGGDAPGSLFKLRDLTGADFYVGVHIFPIKRIKEQ